MSEHFPKIDGIWKPRGDRAARELAGGGALALRPWLEPCFPQARYASDAAMANAVGFLRYGLRRALGDG